MLGKKMEQYLRDYHELEFPVELAPHQVGVHPQNRAGADPNVQVLHNKILNSFAVDGYDPTRHLTPIVVRCSSDKNRAHLQAHNQRFTEGRSEFPPADEKRMEFGTLAGSHLTLALRCIESGVVCQSTGLSAQAIVEKQPNLKQVVERGMRYHVLREDTPLDILSDISQWRNQDQNSNQFSMIWS